MKSIKIVLALFVLVVAGCSSDSGGGETFSSVLLTTKAAVLSNNNLVVSTGGIVSADFSESDVCEAGICYSNVPGPTVLNQVISSSFNLDYSASFSDVTFGTTYYMRAFLRNFDTGEVKYGNEVSITIPTSLTTNIVKNISCSGFSVDIDVASNLSSNTERGICYSTSQNPTVSNETFADSTFGSGTFNMTITNSFQSDWVTANNTYYLRSYVRVDGVYYYGNQVSFRVPGYIGGSGGYVFFDKGETTNGWRYLEAATNYLVNTANGNQYFDWNNCNSTTFLAGLSNDIGTGAANTTIIRNGCNFTTNAAAMAQSTSLNGQSDWFLPSLEELRMLYSLKRENIISYNSNVYSLISSSQQSNTTNWAFNFSTGVQAFMTKTEDSRVWQVRRF